MAFKGGPRLGRRTSTHKVRDENRFPGLAPGASLCQIQGARGRGGGQIPPAEPPDPLKDSRPKVSFCLIFNL